MRLLATVERGGLIMRDLSARLRDIVRQDRRARTRPYVPGDARAGEIDAPSPSPTALGGAPLAATAHVWRSTASMPSDRSHGRRRVTLAAGE